MVKYVQILIIVLFLSSCYWEEPYTIQEQIAEEFYSNYNNIVTITEYLIHAPFDNITIQNNDYLYNNKTYGYWFAYNADNSINTNVGLIPIENKKIVDILTELFRNRKYQTIVKNKNTIHFQLCDNLDMGRGIVFVKDDSKPEMQFVTEIQSLNKENWYYYEVDFNQWKKTQ